MNAILPLVFGLLAAGGAIAESVRRARIRRRVAGGSGVIEDNALVTLRGAVGPLDRLLVAPLSGRQCLAYCARAHVYDAGARRVGRPLVTTHARTNVAAFELQTASDRVLVEGTHVALAMRARTVKQDPARAHAFVTSLGLVYQPDMTSCDEIVILPRQVVTVHGVARMEVAIDTAAESGFREIPRRVRVVGDERHPLLIADDCPDRAPVAAGAARHAA